MCILWKQYWEEGLLYRCCHRVSSRSCTKPMTFLRIAHSSCLFCMIYIAERFVFFFFFWKVTRRLDLIYGGGSILVSRVVHSAGGSVLGCVYRHVSLDLILLHFCVLSCFDLILIFFLVFRIITRTLTQHHCLYTKCWGTCSKTWVGFCLNINCLVFGGSKMEKTIWRFKKESLWVYIYMNTTSSLSCS